MSIDVLDALLYFIQFGSSASTEDNAGNTTFRETQRD
jgi:hypothetical protein